MFHYTIGNQSTEGDPEWIYQRSVIQLRDIRRPPAPVALDLRPFRCQEVEVQAVPEKLKVAGDEDDNDDVAEVVSMDLSEGEIEEDRDDGEGREAEEVVADVAKVAEVEDVAKVDDDEPEIVEMKIDDRVSAHSVVEAEAVSDFKPEDSVDPFRIDSEPDVKSVDIQSLVPRHFVEEELAGLEELANEGVSGIVADHPSDEILDATRFESYSYEDLPSPIPHLTHDDDRLVEAEEEEGGKEEVPTASYLVDSCFIEDDDTGLGPGKNTYHMHMRTEDRIDPEFRSFTQCGDDVSSIPLPSYPSPFESKSALPNRIPPVEQIQVSSIFRRGIVR